ncbi:hypothetical protein [Streptomyces sp. NPDC048191]|uniref:hypothetical protein n=1 Tax=Streptomyces sp. NPDC048191 TaxID=3155484 RepID=UPI0033F11B75
MIGAMVTHGRLGQYKFVALNVVQLAFAVFIAVGHQPTTRPRSRHRYRRET